MYDAVATIKRALAGKLPLIRFAGSPFTLACYMIEGGGSAVFAPCAACYAPDLLHRVLSVNAEAVAAYLAQQVAHGADVLMLFDTWGGLLTTEAYAGFSLAYVGRCSNACASRPAPSRRRSCLPKVAASG